VFHPLTSSSYRCVLPDSSALWPGPPHALFVQGHSPSSSLNHHPRPLLSTSPDVHAASQLSSQARDFPSILAPAAGSGATQGRLRLPPDAADPSAPIDDAPLAAAVPDATDGRAVAAANTIESLAVEVQGMRQQFTDLHRLAVLLSGVPSTLLAFAQQLRESDTTFSPRRWLYTIAGVDEFATGRALQSTLRGKLLDRLQARPAAVARGRDPSIVKVELDCTYGALLQLVRLRRLQLSECTLRQCRASCGAQLESPRAVLDALEIPVHMIPTVMLRCFSRQNGDMVTRLLLENHVTPNGAMHYILGRCEDGRTVSVAVRESEDIDVSLGRHRHPIQQKMVAVDDVVDLPARPPCHLSWHGNMTSSRLEAEANMVWGRLCLVLPSTIVNGDGRELAIFVL